MLLNNFDQDVGRFGLSNATRNLVEGFGEGIEGEFEPGAEQCLLNDSVLVVGTHPGRLNASAILAAMPEREKSFLVGHAMLEKIGPHFGEHLIPIELVNRRRNITGDLVRKLVGFPPRNTDPGEAKAKNQNSLERAVHIVNEGGRVLIFPDNVHKRGDSKWLRGVGQILRQLNPDTKVVFADADPDVHPLAVLKGEDAVSTKVRFSTPTTVREIVGDDNEIDVDSIVEATEQRYRKWKQSNTQPE